MREKEQSWTNRQVEVREIPARMIGVDGKIGERDFTVSSR